MMNEIEGVNNLEIALHKDRERTLSFCNRHARIFLYGAGRTAVQLIDYLQKENVDIAGIIVSDGQKTADYLEDIEIMEFCNYQYEDGDGIILAVAEKKQEIIFQQIKEKHGLNIDDIVYRQTIYSSGEITSEVDWYAGTRRDGTYFASNVMLEEYGAKYGTDKAEKFHNYLHKYEFFLRKWKDEPITLMELGVFRGQSLSMWEDYFCNASIVGVDIDENCRQYKSNRKEIVITDLSKIENLIHLRNQFQPTIIVDDASHGWRDQILAISVLFPSLKSGGVFIMEDLGTSFSKHLYSSENDACISGYDFMALICEASTGSIEHKANKIDRAIVDAAVQLAKDVDMISFIYGACILIKR